MSTDILFQAKRNELVAQLEHKGIYDTAVLQAIQTLPRHDFFTDSTLRQFAYEDKAYPIDAGQTISQPYTVALQTQLLEVKPLEKILEIGTGSGYQAAILRTMGARVFSIERQKQLFFRTKELLHRLNISVETFFGDGFKGCPPYAPFDKIIITAAAPFVPRTLLDQLKVGGIMVVPLGDDSVQILMQIKKLSETEFEQRDFGSCRFVPMLAGIA
ncbi:MAG: protein-L-isoaspartate(D-aspartate) O-methyltransferase [Bacteroidales bacterium]|jgi:protein-L-isoaspartate(D-aspartate) O-methyltransferase|nr:protein-L-isoaspartate(D-aspartate) O-methyltransferase [Bacteroidales bacterium]